MWNRRIQFPAGFPYDSVPERKRLGDLVVSSLPDGELVEAVSVGPGMIFGLLRCVATKKTASPKYDVALAIGIDFLGDSLQALLFQFIVRVQESHDISSCSAEASINGVRLTRVFLDVEAEYFWVLCGELLGDIL